MRCKIPANDLAQRLNETICCYQHLPVLVIVDGQRLDLYDLCSTELIKSIKSDDPEFDVSTPPMGYCQYNKTTVGYITRHPVRRYKQGLSADVCSMRTLGEHDKNQPINVNLRTKYIKDMMSGQYPKLATALAEMVADFDKTAYIAETALSNDCAINITKEGILQVWFRQEKVGYLKKNPLGRRDSGYRPTVVVPNSTNGWIISMYLSEFDWVVE